MLPNADYYPVGGVEFSVHLGVPPSVALNLGVPVADVRFRLPEMHRASMPETSVQENGNLRSRENQVCDAVADEISRPMQPRRRALPRPLRVPPQHVQLRSSR